MWHYVLFRIWRNLHSSIEIDRNQRSDELLKLGYNAVATISSHQNMFYSTAFLEISL